MDPIPVDTSTLAARPMRGGQMTTRSPRGFRSACEQAPGPAPLIVSLSSAATLMLFAVSAHGQVMDASVWVPNREVTSVIRGGNTIYVGGDFTVIGPLTGAGVPLDGATGIAVTPFPKVERGDGSVGAAIPDGAGGWYIGGRFASVGGIARSNLAHILADGRVADWNPGPTGTTNPGGSPPEGAVFALAVSGGTVYVGGDFTTIGGQARRRLAAVDAVTGAATPWNPNPGGDVLTLLVRGSTVYPADCSARWVEHSAGTSPRSMPRLAPFFLGLRPYPATRAGLKPSQRAGAPSTPAGFSKASVDNLATTLSRWMRRLVR